MRIKNQWKNTPVFITENGVADKSDRYRAPFIVAHLQQVKRAIDNGANVIGYLHWSFMDNYEWLDSYRPESKFGLFGIDRDVGKDGQPDFKRHRTRGAEALEFIIKRSLFPKCDLAQRDSVIITAKDKFGTFSANGSHIIND
jgi:beta-glucosidase/6-phospho-beta-glucosidase/beta-galactosidase